MEHCPQSVSYPG